MSSPGSPPCEIVDADTFFARKAQEYTGSQRQWDQIVETVLKDLPRNPKLPDREVHGYDGLYALPFRDQMALVLVYFVYEKDDICEIRLLDLKPLGFYA